MKSPKMRKPQTAPSQQGKRTLVKRAFRTSAPVQRMSDDYFDEEPMQRMADGSLEDEYEDVMQGKMQGSAQTAGTHTPQFSFSNLPIHAPNTHAPTAAQRQVNDTGMPDQLKAGIENHSGMSMDNVRVHYNSQKPAQLNALAYAQGHDIHLGSGQEQHLPHEAWHVVQQMEGRVQPTMEAHGVAINDDKGLEREADIMGSKAASFQPSESH